MNKKRASFIFAILISTIFVSSIIVNGQTDNLKELQDTFSVEDLDDSPIEGLRPVAIAFDLGEQALPFLEGIVDSPNQEKAYLAARCIAFIGGQKATNILKKSFKKTANIGIKTFLCFSLSSTGTKKDIDFLISALPGEHYGDGWPPIQQAAYSLGVLRAKKSISSLEKTAAKKKGFASAAAESALKWINGDVWNTNPKNDTSADESIILTLFRFGIPRLNEADSYIEKESGRIWRCQNKTWTYEKINLEEGKKLPSIYFDIHIAPDLKRAICSIGLIFGPLNGSGYDFVLRKTNGIWKVTGIIQTWVS